MPKSTQTNMWVLKDPLWKAQREMRNMLLQTANKGFLLERTEI